MLILSRKIGETTVYTVPPSDKPTQFTSTVLSISGRQVRIGTNAPQEVEVHREEIQDKIDAEATESTS